MTPHLTTLSEHWSPTTSTVELSWSEAVFPPKQTPFTGTSPEPQSKWDRFIVLADASQKDFGTLGISTIDDVRVSPIIQSRWYQSTICSGTLACYNYYTPPDGNGQTYNYPSGCVATALAQNNALFPVA